MKKLLILKAVMRKYKEDVMASEVLEDYKRACEVNGFDHLINEYSRESIERTLSSNGYKLKESGCGSCGKVVMYNGS